LCGQFFLKIRHGGGESLDRFDNIFRQRRVPLDAFENIPFAECLIRVDRTAQIMQTVSDFNFFAMGFSTMAAIYSAMR